MSEEVRIDDIKVDFDLYPRSGGDNEIISQYRNSINQLPPIELQKEELILIDGFHRLQAHIMEGKKTIQAEFNDIPKEDVLRTAILRNNTHGYQLKSEDKRQLAERLWKEIDTKNSKAKEIAELLAVHPDTVRKWTEEIRKQEQEEYLEEKKKRNKRILDLWLSCWSQEEIAEKYDISQKTVDNILETISNDKNFLEVTNEPPESLRLYDLWQFSKCDNRFGMNYPGRIPGQLIQNLLWYYTEPGDIVVDPMAGSGTTIDVAKSMYRRVAGYDIRPFRRDIIERDTIKDGLPDKFKHKDYRPKLIFVDPPYHTMKKDNYSEKAVSSVDLQEFYDMIKQLAQNCRDMLPKGSYFAFLIQNQTEKDLIDNRPIIHTYNCYETIKSVGFRLIRQINCPQGTQTFQPQQVNKAKEEKRMLGIVRDLVVFEVV